MVDDSGAHILVVDDDPAETAALAQALTAAGYQVSTRPDSLAGLSAVEEEQPALVILDWDLPFIGGDIFLLALRTGLPAPPPVVALLDPRDDPAGARAAGAYTSLPQPVDPDALVRVVAAILGEPGAAGASQ